MRIVSMMGGVGGSRKIPWWGGRGRGGGEAKKGLLARWHSLGHCLRRLIGRIKASFFVPNTLCIGDDLSSHNV
ncbi:unnamed protein product [Strongylus vulgaris]|uniref:Uncharacterized protein n=1 Tax=Strongylus vulgaris TaxID=40348 RepID=A0A3P7IQN9_STRVU|nr:unnamed protein product [Strongylus vulgaris]